jgi:predicted  nucleic acid-binding Zn-ribbon protein
VQQSVIILGMHRSGTSAMAGALQRLGVDFGPAGTPPPDGENPTNACEHLEVVGCHERLLAATRRGWDDPRGLPRNWQASESTAAIREELAGLLRRDFRGSTLWAVKDPRMCRLLPLWLEILADLQCAPRFIVVHRPLVEIAASLERRHGFSPQKTAALWADHVLSAERHTRGNPRVFVSFDRLLSDPEGTMRAVGDTLDLQWPRPSSEATAELREFVSPSLRHHVVGSGSLPTDFGRLSPIVGPPDKILSSFGVAGDPIRATPFDTARQQLTRFLLELDSVVLEHAAQLIDRALAQRPDLEPRLEEQAATLREHGSRLDEQAASLRERESRLDEQAASLRERESRLDEQITSLREHQARLDEQITSLREGRDRLDEQITSLREHQDRLNEQTASSRRHQAKLVEQTASLRERQARLDEQTASLREHQDRVPELRAEVARLQGRVGELSADLCRSVQENAEALRGHFGGRLQEQEVEIKNHRDAMSRLNGTLETLQATLGDRVARSQATPQDLQRVRASAQDLVHRLQEANERLEQQEGGLGRVCANVVEIEAQLNERTEQLRVQDTELNRLRDTVHTLLQRLGWRGMVWRARRALHLSGRVAQTPVRAGKAVTGRARDVWRRSVAPKIDDLRRL